ncbi:thiol:disulfide interchange protein TlpA [Mesorhizobium xinjiangense]|uniref:thiol:disulfide interchange protein TlpA n=1 Tax=Mesorhizobium xinjiangense TaxID=2678685 RepID=UPI0012EDDF83|nr:TlpA disulfide reductase family protein [Mesorhizobium xinjiangense]
MKKLHLPAMRLVLLAAVAGAIAGGIAVYVTNAPSGNTRPDGQLAGAAAPSAADKTCAANAERARALADAAQGEVAAMLPADPPRNLADLAFNGPDGAPMTVADLSGKTVLMNLWATWCAPCRAEMPALDALQRDMGGEEFEVVAVNVDTGDDTKPKAFLSDIGIETLAYYRDNTLGLFNEVKKRGLALGLPVTLLIDAQGCLLAHMNGPAEWASDDAKTFIRTAIGE